MLMLGIATCGAVVALVAGRPSAGATLPPGEGTTLAAVCAPRMQQQHEEFSSATTTLAVGAVRAVCGSSVSALYLAWRRSLEFSTSFQSHRTRGAQKAPQRKHSATTIRATTSPVGPSSTGTEGHSEAPTEHLFNLAPLADTKAAEVRRRQLPAPPPVLGHQPQMYDTRRSPALTLEEVYVLVHFLQSRWRLQTLASSWVGPRVGDEVGEELPPAVTDDPDSLRLRCDPSALTANHSCGETTPSPSVS